VKTKVKWINPYKILLPTLWLYITLIMDGLTDHPKVGIFGAFLTLILSLGFLWIGFNGVWNIFLAVLTQYMFLYISLLARIYKKVNSNQTKINN
jgi:hypothetical protein